MKKAQTFLSHEWQKLYFTFVKKNNKKLSKSPHGKAIVTLFLNFLVFFLNVRDECSQVME